ncbi:nuclear transport factor 2 family protein [Sphingomonas sp.]|uniref:nuclear transport factor 2 family protein n=1 Tax=Sphingomonas sp. TaxID=28214 RepID=UPI003D6C77AB
MSIEPAIAAWLDIYFEAWNRYDVPAMKACWDEEDQLPIYLAEECDPHIGWEAVLGYWGIDRSKSERLVTWKNLTAKEAAPGFAVILFDANWSTYIPGSRLYPRPFGGPVRITAALRLKPEGWRMFHYVEAPLASIVQLRRAHEDAVEPALHARLAAKGISY